MKLRLKENPREWYKFAALASIFAGIAVLLLRRRGIVAIPLWTVLLPAVLAFAVGWVRPRWLRAIYRMAMTASHRFGGVMGILLLSLFFLLIVTPLGLLLRLSGKDLLNLKRTNATTYWRTAKNQRELERLF
ncbi:MAG: hypothetical protein JWM99_713 [Verrucomicrobiales bacterium]|jgi:hypothetical protein|nr:hypothetical protein [Verrucomicrobiales bacterium]